MSSATLVVPWSVCRVRSGAKMPLKGGGLSPLAPVTPTTGSSIWASVAPAEHLQVHHVSEHGAHSTTSGAGAACFHGQMRVASQISTPPIR